MANSPLFSQNNISWSVSFDSDKECLDIRASIDKGWHLYSVNVDETIGPVATSFTFEESKKYKLLGEIIQPEPITEYDENFGGSLSFFEGDVGFKQELKIKDKDPFELKGEVNYMVCNDVMCLPPIDVEFSIRMNE
jgi:hypothetical protein